MALTYQQTYELTKDPVFRGRVSTACVHYAIFISDNAGSSQAQKDWSKRTLPNPEPSVNECIATVCNDTAVQDAPGAAITDPALQGAVETAVNKLL